MNIGYIVTSEQVIQMMKKGISFIILKDTQNGYDSISKKDIEDNEEYYIFPNGRTINIGSIVFAENSEYIIGKIVKDLTKIKEEPNF